MWMRRTFLDDGRTVETLPLDTLVGRAMCCTADVDVITAAVLMQADIRLTALLFKTRNSEYWRAARISSRRTSWP
jgi:kynurenine formamidase